MSSILRAKLFRTSPYEGFVAQPGAEDRQGWGSDHRVFKNLIARVKPRLIIEVGSWKGMSALTMAKASQALQLDVEIVCVDTWLGSPGLYTRPNDEFYGSLKHVNGYPSLFYTFLSNVVASGLQEMITPLPLPSQLAADVLANFGAKADMIYIDAAHDYRSVAADLESFWPLLAPTGVLFGDDYGVWPGVTKAANEFAAKVDRPILTGPGKFVIPKAPLFDMSATLL